LFNAFINHPTIHKLLIEDDGVFDRFRVFFRLNNGKLYESQLKELLGSIEPQQEYGDEYVKQLMTQLDTKGKGYITFDDFVEGYSKVQEMIEYSNTFTELITSSSEDGEINFTHNDEDNHNDKNMNMNKYELENENNHLKMEVSKLKKHINKAEKSLEKQYKKIKEQKTVINKHKNLLRKHESTQLEKVNLSEQTEMLKATVKNLEENVKDLNISKVQLSQEKNQLKELLNEKLKELYEIQEQMKIKEEITNKKILTERTKKNREDNDKIINALKKR